MTLRKYIFVAPLILAGCATPGQNGKTYLSDQDKQSCTLHGLASAMLAQRRDNGLSIDVAITDIRDNFSRFDQSEANDRLAIKDTVNSVETIAKVVFERPQHMPKTFLYTYRPICLVQKTSGLNQDRVTAFFAKALDCQARYPLAGASQRLDRRDVASEQLQECIENIAGVLVAK